MKFDIDVDTNQNSVFPSELITGISKVKKLIENDIMKRYMINKLERLPDGNYVVDLDVTYEIVDVKIKIKRKDK